MGKQRFLVYLKVIAGLLLLYLLFTLIDLKAVWVIIKQADVFWVFASILLFGVTYLLQALRLQWLTSSYQLSFVNIFKAQSIGLFFDSFLPGGAGGDVYKVYYFNQQEKGISKALTLTLIDRLAGMLVMILFLFLYVIFYFNRLKSLDWQVSPQKIWWGLGAVFAGLIMTSTVLWLMPKLYQRIRKAVSQAWNTILSLTGGQIWGALFISLVIHVFRGISMLWVFWALHTYSIEFVDVIFVFAVTGLLIVLPISVGALGFREGMIVAMLIPFGIPTALGAGFALLSRAILWLFALLGGLLYLLDRRT